MRGGAATMVGAGALALACGEARAAPADADKTAAVPIVVVTAEKREQNLETVPIAITAFNAARRDKLGILTIQDMTNFTPGLNYSAGSDRITLRGVGRTTNVLSADTPVANYDDDIYQTFATDAGRSSLDLDRVEVLRGPQGTLAGRNALAGAIYEVTQRPTSTPYAEVRVTYGNYDHRTLEGALSGPLNDDWAFRVYAGWDYQSRGWVKNTAPGAPDAGNIINEWSLDAQIQGHISDRLDMWTKVEAGQWFNGAGGPGDNSSGWSPAGNYDVEFAPGGLEPNPGYACSPGFPGSGVVDLSPSGCDPHRPRQMALLQPRTVTLPELITLDSQWTWHADGFEIKYVGGGTYYHYILRGETGPIVSFQLPVAAGGAFLGTGLGTCFLLNQFGAPCSALTVNPLDSFVYQEKNGFFSNELTFVSTGAGPLQWVAGLYQFYQAYQQPVSVPNVGQPQLNGPFPAVCFQYGPACAPQTGFTTYDNRPSLRDSSLAAYGQIDWKATDTLKLTLGVRYSHDHRYGEERARIVCFAVPSCIRGTPEDLGSFTPAIDLTQVPGVVDPGPPFDALPKGVVSSTTYDAATGLATRLYRASWQAPSGTAGVEWTPDADTLAYFKYGRGYKSGGLNVGIFTSIAAEPWTDAEYVNSFEVGLKRTLGHSLTVNAAAFWYDYRNLQIPISVINTTGGVAVAETDFYNVPKSISRGIELETTWTPVHDLTVTFDYSFLDAFVTKGVGEDPADPNAYAPGAQPLYTAAECAAAALTNHPVCTPDVYTETVAQGGTSPVIPGDAGQGWNIPQSLAGQRLPNAPRNKIALNVTYALKTRIGEFTPSVSYLWRDVSYGIFFTRSYNAAPAWDQWDARLGWTSPSGRVEAIAFVKNAFNTLGYDAGANGARLAGTTDVLQPDGSYLPVNYVQGVNGPAGFSTKVAGLDSHGVVTSYDLTPPRTFGLELHYKFF